MAKDRGKHACVGGGVSGGIGGTLLSMTSSVAPVGVEKAEADLVPADLGGGHCFPCALPTRVHHTTPALTHSLTHSLTQHLIISLTTSPVLTCRAIPATTPTGNGIPAHSGPMHRAPRFKAGGWYKL